jgi:hypothetical protein
MWAFGCDVVCGVVDGLGGNGRLYVGLGLIMDDGKCNKDFLTSIPFSNSFAFQ